MPQAEGSVPQGRPHSDASTGPRCRLTGYQAGLPLPHGVGNSPEGLTELRDPPAHAHRPILEAVTQERLPEEPRRMRSREGRGAHTLRGDQPRGQAGRAPP